MIYSLVVYSLLFARFDEASALAPWRSVSSSSGLLGCRALGPSPRRYHRSPTSALSALPKDELLRLTEEYLANPSPDWWAEDFVFRGPVIGPLVKRDLIATLESVGSDTSVAFPDLEINSFGLTADDPIDPNRVWYFVRPRGTFLGPFRHPVVGLIEPTGAAYVGPPEARSVIWDDSGKIRYQSVGYVTDRVTGDTAGGRGAVFGQYAVMGQEIDATVGSTATVLLQRLAGMLPEGMIPKSYSKREDVPDWWNDERMGAEA